MNTESKNNLSNNKLAKKIIGRLNAYCLRLDHRGLGLPVLDECAMMDMEDMIVKILVRNTSGVEWQKQQPNKIDKAIEWCDEQIKKSFCRDAPVATTLKEYPYVEMKQYLKSLK